MGSSADKATVGPYCTQHDTENDRETEEESVEHVVVNCKAHETRESSTIIKGPNIVLSILRPFSLLLSKYFLEHPIPNFKMVLLATIPSTASMAADKENLPCTSTPEPSTSSQPEPSTSSQPEPSTSSQPEPPTSSPEASLESSVASLPAVCTPSPLSRRAQKKREREQEHRDQAQLELLEQRRASLMQRKEEDEDSRFAATLVDVLKNLPADKRLQVRRRIYNAAVDMSSRKKVEHKGDTISKTCKG
ncbi:hypothetical protein EYF80_041321 [Liparis tanakae]|uniref:BESS domain-containing protein n=1 Tax=Liparis tanakae TaxID=230148 RepID=A0A4Z2G5S9_9TELE|nr:hypothetical protein EYF80_041321 [Liparis tanakae]